MDHKLILKLIGWGVAREPREGDSWSWGAFGPLERKGGGFVSVEVRPDVMRLIEDARPDLKTSDLPLLEYLALVLGKRKAPP